MQSLAGEAAGKPAEALDHAIDFGDLGAAVAPPANQFNEFIENFSRSARNDPPNTLRELSAVPAAVHMTRKKHSLDCTCHFSKAWHHLRIIGREFWAPDSRETVALPPSGRAQWSRQYARPIVFWQNLTAADHDPIKPHLRDLEPVRAAASARCRRTGETRADLKRSKFHECSRRSQDGTADEWNRNAAIFL